MTCEHRFVPMPASRRVIYCEHCGAFREFAGAQKDERPARAPRRREREGALELPFGMPLAVGKTSPIEGDGRPASSQELAELEARFAGGASPLSDAAAINEFAERAGMRRPPQGDPPGTYRPGETETPPWLAPRPQ